MKFFWLAPKDQRFNNWIFHRESEAGVQIREDYASLKCPKCGKFDELLALNKGIAPDVQIRSKSDYLIADDGVICISISGQRMLDELGITGFRFIPIPADSRYSVALPQAFIPTVANETNMEFHRPCPNCGRFRETCLFPVLASMSLSKDAFRISCPNVTMEGVRGRKFWYLASNDATTQLRKRKFSGVEYIPAR